MIVEVLVSGINPVPWKAPEVSVGRKGGRTYPQFYKDAGLVAYQTALKECILEAYPEPPCFPAGATLAITFGFWRVLDAGVVDDRRRRAHYVDATNLQKSTEDALQGVLYPNDRHNVMVQSVVVAQGPDVEPLVLISIKDNPIVSQSVVTEWVDQLDLLEAPSPPGNVKLQLRSTW